MLGCRAGAPGNLGGSFNLVHDGSFRIYSRHSQPISLDNLPRIDQCREVEPDNVHPQVGPFGVFDHGANDGILDLAAMQVHTDTFAHGI